MWVELTLADVSPEGVVKRVDGDVRLGGYVNRLDGAITFDLEGDDFDDRCYGYQHYCWSQSDRDLEGDDFENRCHPPGQVSLFDSDPSDPLLRFTVADGCSYDLELLLNAYQRDWEEGEFEDVRMTITVGGLPPVRSRTTPKMFRNALPSLLRGSNARPAG